MASQILDSMPFEEEEILDSAPFEEEEILDSMPLEGIDSAFLQEVCDFTESQLFAKLVESSPLKEYRDNNPIGDFIIDDSEYGREGFFALEVYAKSWDECDNNPREMWISEIFTVEEGAFALRSREWKDDHRFFGSLIEMIRAFYQVKGLKDFGSHHTSSSKWEYLTTLNDSTKFW